MNATGILGFSATFECLLEYHFPGDPIHISYHTVLGVEDVALHGTRKKNKRTKGPRKKSKALNLDLE